VTEKRKHEKRSKALKIVGALAGLALLISCSAIAGAVFLSIPEPTAMPAPVTTVIASTIPTTEPSVCDSCPMCEPNVIVDQECPVCEVCEVCPTEVPAPTPAPVTEPVVFEGSGGAVTDNMRLSACQKSVFSWQHGGTSNFFVNLCGESCGSLIIAGRDDATGEAFQPLGGGEYYLVVESVEGPWTITWECRD